MPPFKSLRASIPWFPSIDYDACLKDLKCVNFCPHEVFEWDVDTGRPVVAHALRCLPGCTICLERVRHRRPFLADQTRIPGYVR